MASAIAFFTANGTFMVALLGYRNFFRSLITMNIYIKREIYIKQQLQMVSSKFPSFLFSRYILLLVLEGASSKHNFFPKKMV